MTAARSRFQTILHYITTDKKVKTACAALLIVMSAVALWSFISTPFTGDIKVFFAAANQVKYQSSSGILAVFSSWELKGIANRLLIYGIYLLADWLVGYDNKIAFEYAANAIYAVFLLLILFAAAYFLPAEKRTKRAAFFLSFFSFFTVNALISQQAEMTCVALCLLITSLLLCGKKPALILSGFLGALLFFFKSIFILLYGCSLLCALVFDFYSGRHSGRARQYLLSAASMLLFEAVLCGAVLLVYPQEFRDMLNASNFQSTLLSEGSNVSLRAMVDSLSAGFVTSIVMIPTLFLGIIAAVRVLIATIQEKQYAVFLTLVFLWVIPLDIIVVANNYFAYHYFLLILPSIASLLLLLKTQRTSYPFLLACAGAAFFFTLLCRMLKDGLHQFPLINNSTVLLVALHLFGVAVIVSLLKSSKAVQKGLLACVLTVCLFFWMNYSSVIAPYHRNIVAIEKAAADINRAALPADFGEERVLYLDSGLIAFYADAPSYSRYFFNLPMQRYQNGDDWDCQKSEHELLLGYTGKYIVYSDWFHLEKYPDLKEKLENEYVKLENSNLLAYSPAWDLFSLAETPTRSTVSDEIYILVRKE